MAEEGLLLTEAQGPLLNVNATSNRKSDSGKDRDDISRIPRSQDTFYVGTMKDVGRIYQQTFCRYLHEGGPCEAAYDQDTGHGGDLLNDGVLPFYLEHEVPLLRVLTVRASEYCRTVEQTTTSFTSR